jgi:hypothetical protein
MDRGERGGCPGGEDRFGGRKSNGAAFRIDGINADMWHRTSTRMDHPRITPYINIYISCHWSVLIRVHVAFHRRRHVAARDGCHRAVEAQHSG